MAEKETGPESGLVLGKRRGRFFHRVTSRPAEVIAPGLVSQLPFHVRVHLRIPELEPANRGPGTHLAVQIRTKYMVDAREKKMRHGIAGRGNIIDQEIAI